MIPSRDSEPSVLPFHLAYCIIYVADLPAMARFYSEVLRLPIAEENARFVAFGGTAAPLALEAGGQRSAAHGRKIRTRPFSSSRSPISLRL